MGWYFRKSISSGPFRMNFSKSGIGYSFGVKGARISTGPRGTYVNFGSNGIYYREKIGGNPKGGSNLPIIPIVPELKHTITSGEIGTLTDADSTNFINELTEKSRKISYLNWFGILPFAIFILTLIIYFNVTIRSVVDEKQIVTINSPKM